MDPDSAWIMVKEATGRPFEGRSRDVKDRKGVGVVCMYIQGLQMSILPY